MFVARLKEQQLQSQLSGIEHSKNLQYAVQGGTTDSTPSSDYMVSH